MDDPPVVIILNYHRVGPTDPGNPLHRLHAVATDVFLEQLAYLEQRGRIVSLEDIRLSQDLGSLNFALTFDDVPTGALNGIRLLEDRCIPFGLSICGQLATVGWGLRDKVYCILKYLDGPEIERFVRAHPPAAYLQEKAISFYQLTKRPDLDPDFVKENLIEPLFARVSDRAKPYLSHAYLSWQDIRDHFVDDPLVTLADHSWGHGNLAAYERDRLDGEVVQSHHTFTRELGRPPTYFAVPFGQLTQGLALDLITLLQRLGYQGVLWVGHVGNTIRGPSDAQIIQLIRLHAPTTAADFIGSVEHAVRHRVEGAIRQVENRLHGKPSRVIASSSERPVLNFEMLMRQGKDYASDPRFYDYQFTSNPYKGDRPDYYAMVHAGRIEATAYNFHASFHLGRHVVPGVYLSSWRRLPEAHVAASGLLVRRMTERECVVGVYKPNPMVARAFQDWRCVRVYRHIIPAPDDLCTRSNEAGPHGVSTFDRYDDSFTELAQTITKRAGFTIVRDAVYYAWRFDAYPLARCEYFSLLAENAPVGFCAVLRRGATLSLADFSAPSPEVLEHLVRHVLVGARSSGATSVTLETSKRTLSDHLTIVFGGSVSMHRNYYHFNHALLAERGVEVDVERVWSEGALHETEATGDVLLR
jgi:peptidoglycan/xylan/chitin deacetylase (PgdA/CDA1 family)